jgi:hypothetical protein
MKKTMLACLFLAAVTPLYSGVMEDFGPFLDPETIVRVALQPCTLLRSTTTEGKTVEEFGLPGETQKPFLTLEVDNSVPEKYTAILKMDFGPKEPAYEGVIEGASWFMDILTADLNGDAKPDFVIPYNLHETGGIGQSEEAMGSAPSRGQDVLFALSGKEKLRFTVVSDVQFDEDGFVSLLNDGTVQWVHTALFAGPKGQGAEGDRKALFYLHRLYNIQEDGLALSEGLDSRFPKFVSYYPGSRRKNHKETKLLTDVQKKEMLDKYPVKTAEWAVKVTMPAVPTPVIKKKPVVRKKPVVKKPAVKKPVAVDASPTTSTAVSASTPALIPAPKPTSKSTPAPEPAPSSK